MNEKSWIISYAVMHENGTTTDIDENLEEIVEARTIDGALRLANQRVSEITEEPGVRRVVVWNIGIMDDEVF